MFSALSWNGRVLDLVGWLIDDGHGGGGGGGGGGDGAGIGTECMR